MKLKKVKIFSKKICFTDFVFTFGSPLIRPFSTLSATSSSERPFIGSVAAYSFGIKQFSHLFQKNSHITHYILHYYT